MPSLKARLPYPPFFFNSLCNIMPVADLELASSSETFFEDSYPFASRCLVSPLRTGYLRGGPALGGGLLYLVRAVLPAARCTRLASPPRAPGPACGAPLAVYSPTDTRNCYFVHADLYVASPHADGMHSHSLPVAALLAISAFAASSAKSRA